MENKNASKFVFVLLNRHKLITTIAVQSEGGWDGVAGRVSGLEAEGNAAPVGADGAVPMVGNVGGGNAAA